MEVALLVGTFVVGVASAVYSVVQQAKVASEQAKKQAQLAKEAQALGEKNRKLIEQETAEALRRKEFEQQKQMASARAVAAATGFKSDEGSFSLYMTEMEEQNQADLEWIKRSGASRADIEMARTRYNVMEIKSRPTATVEWGQFATSIMGSASGLYSGGKDLGYWGTTKTT